MSFRIQVRGLLLVLLCAGLVACGFKLAGTSALPKSISSIYLVSPGFNDSQRALLIKKLEEAGASLVSSANIASRQLVVNLREIPNRTLVNSARNGKTVERLARSLEYSVKSADGEVLVASTSLVQQRDVTLDEDNLHSSNRERRDVLDSLEIALFNQLVHRLQRL